MTIRREEFRYRVIEEANLSKDDPKYFVQIYRKNYSTFFNRREWMFESEYVERGGYKAKEFKSFADAREHVNRIAKVLKVKEQGTIQRDVIQ